MTEAVRLSDVAESIVQTYLYGVVSRLSESSLPQDAWFRVTAQRTVLPIDENTEGTIEPVFEVMLVVDGPSENVAQVITEAAAELPGRVTVMPRAVSSRMYSKEHQIRTGWTQTHIPSMRGVTPQFSAAG